jgi:hypothetical protein
MQPSKGLLDAMTALLAADTASLGAATALHVHLIAAPFSPNVLTDFTALTEATFTGSAAMAAGTGTQQVFVDPLTGLRTIQLLEPAGGWTWLCTVTPGATETIYGFCVTNTANAVTWGSALLPTPVPISASGQGIHIPFLTFAVNPLALS